MKKICLIGCGNIGSRHLQGLVKTSFPIDIKIIEPFLKSQELGKQRLSEIQYDKELHNISWMKNIDELNDKPDLTIIATLAVGRVNLICELLEMGHSRFLIEKIVCQSDNEYERLMKKLKMNLLKMELSIFQNIQILLRVSVEYQEKSDCM